MSRADSIQTLQEMGFSEIQAIGALNASKDDLNKAIGFLFGEVDDTVGSGSERSPIHVEQVSMSDYDSVAVSNPSDIPDFSSMSRPGSNMDKAESATLSESNSSIQDSVQGLNVVRERVYKESSSSDEEIEDLESDTDEPFPPTEKLEAHKFPVILNKEKALRTWVPLIAILANFPPFVKVLESSESNEPVVKELQKITKHFTSFAESSSWYVTTQDLAQQLPAEFPVAKYADNEMLLNMMNFLTTLEPAFKPMFESTVISVEDDIHNELVVLEIEPESRKPTLYETLNELFWQKNYELFGQIKYSYVAPLVIYQLEYEENTSCVPFQLPETFYPEIYSNKALKQVKEELDSMALAERNYHEVSKKLMELNFFSGMKVDNLLQKAASSVAQYSPDSASDLENLLVTLGQQRAQAIEQQNAHRLDASPQRLRSFDRLVNKNPDLQPYTLLGVIFSETQYFMKYNGIWVDMATGAITDFAAVKHSVEVASSVGPHLITILYELQGGSQNISEAARSSSTSQPAEKTRANIDPSA